MRAASPAGDVRVDIKHVRGLVVMTVAGALDLDTAHVLDAALDALKSGQRAVLDLCAVICKDTTALDLLIAHSQRMNRSGGALLVRCPPAVG